MVAGTPYVDPHTGNFVCAQYVLVNHADEVLVEIKDAGGIFIPGDYIVESDISEEMRGLSGHPTGDDFKIAAVDRLLKSELGIDCLDKENFYETVHIEDEKRFTCVYFLCRNWAGEIEKVSKHNVRLMWVNKQFASQLLSVSADKSAVKKLL